MIFNVRALGNQKHHETGHAEVDWLTALESARQSLRFVEIDYGDLELIALASRSPAKFTVMSRLIYQYGKSYPFHSEGDQITDVILNGVNASPFTLADWIDAIDGFYSWLVKNGRKVDFLPMLKYLE